MFKQESNTIRTRFEGKLFWGCNIEWRTERERDNREQEATLLLQTIIIKA